MQLSGQAARHRSVPRARRNMVLSTSWTDWQVPSEVEDGWSERAKRAHRTWTQLLRERQELLRNVAHRSAEKEFLFDRPYEDSARVRVSGPFTVESLSPHRILSTDEDRTETEEAGKRDCFPGQFETMILENLKKAGVQNTKKDERLRFEYLDAYPGQWVHGCGAFFDKDEHLRNVAISIGPEHGTVGPEQVKEAAKETLRDLLDVQLLIVCGFAFDAHANDTAQKLQAKGASFAVENRKLGKLPLMLAHINPDLAMGSEVLKKTGAGNLFMVFGEPDVNIEKQADGRVVVEVRGVDIFDPTTGQVRSSSPDDLACWFIDTAYNQESFFVRHAYFTGGNEPYDKLRRALRAEIDEAAWSSLYTTRSRPFEIPKTERIAVKVINHYGDEVMKVYTVP